MLGNQNGAPSSPNSFSSAINRRTSEEQRCHRRQRWQFGFEPTTARRRNLGRLGDARIVMLKQSRQHDERKGRWCV